MARIWEDRLDRRRFLDEPLPAGVAHQCHEGLRVLLKTVGEGVANELAQPQVAQILGTRCGARQDAREVVLLRLAEGIEEGSCQSWMAVKDIVADDDDAVKRIDA